METSICDNKNYGFGNGYILMPIVLDGLPRTVQVEGCELSLKSNFHASLVGVKYIVERYGQEIDDIQNKCLEIFCDVMREHPIIFLRFTGEFRFVAQGEKKTLVAMCELSNIDSFFNMLRQTLGIEVDTQPTHVTLYTLQPDAGIGITSQEQLKNRTKVVSVSDAVRLVLAIA